MILIKTDEEVELMRQSSLLVSNTLAEIAKNIAIGTNGLKLDRIAEEYIRDHGGVPAFKGYKGFPNTLCISKNDAVVHGIPDAKDYIPGDIVSVDTGAVLNGYYGDSAYTFCLGMVNENVRKLVSVTKRSLTLGIEAAIDGNRVGDISHAIQYFCEKENSFSCVRELVGHGIGKNLHEAPEVPNYGNKGTGPKLLKNMVIAIEPMVNLGKRSVYTGKDDWTILTKDRMPSVHFEHTVSVDERYPKVLTSFERIEEEIKTNKDIVYID